MSSGDSSPNPYAPPDAELGTDDRSVPGTPVKFGETIRVVVSRLGAAFRALFGLVVLWAVVQVAIRYYLAVNSGVVESTGQPDPVFFGSAALMILGPGVVWLYGMRRLHNLFEDRDVRDEFEFVFDQYFSLAGYFLLSAAITAVGLVLLIVPGVVVGLMLYYGSVSLVAEEYGPIDALKRTRQLFNCKEDWFYVFGIWLVTALVVALPVGLVAGFAAGMTDYGPMIESLVDGGTDIYTYPIILTALYTTYQGLVARNEERQNN